MASRDTQRVNERLRLAEEAAAQGNYQAAVNYAAAAIPYSNTQASTQNVLNIINAYSAAGRPAETGGGNPNPGDNNPPGGGPPQSGPPPRSAIGSFTRRALGGKVQVVVRYSDGSEEVIDESIDKSAGDAAAEMFRAAGLNAEFVNRLMQTIDDVYNKNINPNQAQILNAIYSSDAYKQRFKANEVIRGRLADGEGRPGDRLLSPKEYIDLEDTYREVLQRRGMPEGFYDSPDDFVNLISNGISPAEFQSRVDTAASALNQADPAIVNTLQSYYNLTKNDLVAYLLDPTRAQPILNARSLQGGFGLNRADELQRIYSSAEVGGMAQRQNLDLGRGLAEEIVDLGKKDRADEAFQMAGAADQDLRRLGSLYGEAMDFRDLVKESLNLTGGIDSGRKRRKFASKERAAFSATGALDDKSLRRMQDV